MQTSVQTKSFLFAKRIVNLCKYLRAEQKEIVMAKQFSSIFADCNELERLLISIVKSTKE